MTTDFINALFELIGAVLLTLHIRQLRRDKLVRGVSIIPVAFFTIWGYWNCYYYPSVNSMLSFYAGIDVAVVNTIWLLHIIYYRAKETYEY